MKLKIISFLLLLILSSGFAGEFAKSSFKTKKGRHSESFRSMTFNGAWCWFSDPRAVYYEGVHKRTYAGWIDNYGDVHVGYYDHDSEVIESTVLYDGLQTDDHNNPSLLFGPEGHLFVFFSKHGGPHGLFLVRAKNPEDITVWHDVQNLKLNDSETNPDMWDTYTYTNPVLLSEEDNRIYLFWRGIDNKPCYAISDDLGESWSKGSIFILPDRLYSNRRPYVKIDSDGKKSIHVAFTDGHPRRESENSIYTMTYRDGAWYRANGEKIKDLDSGPVHPMDADLVYDAKRTGEKAWIWDVAADDRGYPVMAYAKFPDDSSHVLSYARWDGEDWQNYDLLNSGGWFPETLKDAVEKEPNYSGGLSIDHDTPDVVYLSANRDSVFEIEKWTTKNGGKSWKAEAVTHGSSKDNVRPFAVRGAGKKTPVQVLWMQNTRYHHYAAGSRLMYEKPLPFEKRFHASIKMDVQSPLVKNVLKKESIGNIMRQVADWQMANPFRPEIILDWHWGAYFTGFRALYEVTGHDRYLNEMINIGQAADWQLMDDIFHADRLTIADMFLWLYEKRGDPEMIDKTRWAMDIHLARNYEALTDVRFTDNPAKFEWWTWCDALFMAPPSFARMAGAVEEPKYLKYADTQWWKTSDYMYSTEDSLYFRDDRYFERRSDNGTKIFWSRGNGWVIAGLARMLTLMPEDYPNRVKFEQQYREMAHKILSIQGKDGLWRVSLIDPEYLDLGESSGSSFYTFALAWGINNGYVDRKYQPAVEKAWQMLCRNVNEWGRLGYVQQVAGDPYPFFEHQWHVYASGAFMLAGKEMISLVQVQE